MTVRLIKFLFGLTVIVLTLIVYLSFFGINTSKFNNKIKSSALNINKKVNLKLNNVKLLLNLRNLSINVKTFRPEIIVYGEILEFDSIKTSIPLKSLFNDDFLIDNLIISTKQIKLNNLILLARTFKNSGELLLLGNSIKGGYLVGDININLDKNGKIKENYTVNGYIKKARFEALKKYSIQDLNLTFKIENKKYYFNDVEGEFNKVKFVSPSIKIKEIDNKFLVNGRLISKKKTLNSGILNFLFGNRFKRSNLNDIILSSNNDFNFTINKKFKIENLNYSSKINLDNLSYQEKLLNFKKYLPSFKELIKLKNHEILIKYQENRLNISGKGKIVIEDKEDSLDYNILKKGNQYFFESNINIKKNPLLLKILQYSKKEDLDSILKINGVYNENKNIEFKLISFNENKNNFLIRNLKLNNKYKISDLKLLELDYANDNKIKNQITLKKNEEDYKIYGASFDATKLIDEIFNENNKKSKSIFNNLNSTVNILINKTYLDKDTFVNNLKGKINLKKEKINNLNLDSTFPNKKKLTVSIVTNESKEKITTLFSDFPKPLIKRYKFIKGFDGGILDFHSTKKNGISNSILKIDNFKVKEVPIFASLLSLASLQGIADLLTGEGIRFTDFEMKFSNKNGLTTIDELYSIGPAVSILMDGYIEKNKTISLRGTLVPATTINRTIASIPLIGNILVGKKVGEGVFGVSFKIKGQSNNLKTSVNPVKTLTPRFITRTLEKIKKN